MYILMDLERTMGTGIAHYWNPGKRGYTQRIEEAGLYSEKEAKEIVDSDYDKRTVMISEEVVKKIFFK